MDLPPLRARHFLPFAAIYLYAFPYFGGMKSAEELPRVLLAQEMVDRGIFYLDNRVPEMSTSLELSRGRRVHFYPTKAPGPSLLAVPGYLLCKAFGVTSLRALTWVFRVTVVILPALVFLLVLYRVAGRFAPSEPARQAALVAYALGSPALVYGLLFIPHQGAALYTGSAFALAVRIARGETGRPKLLAALAGLLAGTAVLTEYHAALAALVLCAYVGVRARPRVRNLSLFLLGALPPLGALMTYQAVCFGSPFRTGFATAVEESVKGSFLGLVGPSWASLASTLLLPAKGLLPLVPWVAVAAAGGIAIARSRELRARVGAEAVCCAALFVGYVLLVAFLHPSLARGGWSVGPRYLTVALPFLCWLSAAGFEAAERATWTRVLALASVVFACVVFVVAATTYPHWPDDLTNPLHELSFRLLGAGYAVHSLGTLVGLRSLWAILPLYLFVLGLVLWLLLRGRRRPALSVGLACLLAAAALAGTRALPRSGLHAERAWGFVTATWEPQR